MQFNTILFFLFLLVTFYIYWFVVQNNLKLQNLFILASSYFFYGWWDWRFLSLIFISSLVDFLVGLQLSKSRSLVKKKNLLLCSLLTNLGMLAFFKYFNFFLDSLTQIIPNSLISYHSLKIILPVGISFYTFQTLSYTIDLYKGKIQHCKDPIAFFSFVSFFPQLVAGPIERASKLLPQFEKNRVFDINQAKQGLRLILWGLFKKIVIADTCAANATYIFAHYEALSGSMLLIGSVYFAFQIYCDFSGYSDIAIGTARLFGIHLNTNFRNPYFSKSINEFWCNWHISLSTWFRDYVYIPLGGNRCSIRRQIVNCIITFVLSGLWHGANWTFVLWGLLNGIYCIPGILLQRISWFKNIKLKKLFKVLIPLRVLITFFLISLAWVFFRSQTLEQSFTILDKIFSSSLFSNPLPEMQAMSNNNMIRNATLAILSLTIFEFIQRIKPSILKAANYHLLFRWFIYFALLTIIVVFYGDSKQFIYFDF